MGEGGKRDRERRGLRSRERDVPMAESSARAWWQSGVLCLVQEGAGLQRAEGDCETTRRAQGSVRSSTRRARAN